MSEVTKVVSAENAPINNSMNYAKKYEASYEDSGGSSSDSDVYIVTFDYDGEGYPITPTEQHPITVDKTYAEIEAAALAGKLIVGKFDTWFTPTIASYTPADGDFASEIRFDFPMLLTDTNVTSHYIVVDNMYISMFDEGMDASDYQVKINTYHT